MSMRATGASILGAAGPGAYPDLKAAKAVTMNACGLCAPLGAVLAYAGIEGCVSLLHGSQGCSTYMRRYLISHFREPLDVASSNFTEETAVFGGESRLLEAIANLEAQYGPKVIAVGSACLSETMGEDLSRILSGAESPGHAALVWASTPSYAGTHRDGFKAALKAIARRFCGKGAQPEPTGLIGRPAIVIEPAMSSPADLRWIKALGGAMGFEPILLSDWSERLDGGPWEAYAPIPPGGAKLRDLARASSAVGALELGALPGRPSAADWLGAEYGYEARGLGLPIGVEACDAFFDALKGLGSGCAPEGEAKARERLVDAYFDGHKYLSGLRVAVAAEEDLALALALFLREAGAEPVLCAASGRGAGLAEGLGRAGLDAGIAMDDADYGRIEAAAREAGAELLVGNGKAYSLARALGVPLARVGMPIHDRFGAARIRSLGYEGSLALYDSIVNAVLAWRQDESPLGYSYL